MEQFALQKHSLSRRGLGLAKYFVRFFSGPRHIPGLKSTQMSSASFGRSSAGLILDRFLFFLEAMPQAEAVLSASR